MTWSHVQLIFIQGVREDLLRPSGAPSLYFPLSFAHLKSCKDQTWPSVQRFSVIGPSGDEFLSSVKSVVSETLGAAQQADALRAFESFHSLER